MNSQVESSIKQHANGINQLKDMLSSHPIYELTRIVIFFAFFVSINAWWKEVGNWNFVGPKGLSVGQLTIAYIIADLAFLGYLYLLFLLGSKWTDFQLESLSKSEKLIYTISIVIFLARNVLFLVGGDMDAIWHYKLGGAGQDAVWLPHIIIYISVAIALLPLLFWARNWFSRRWAKKHWPIALVTVTCAAFAFYGGLDLNWHAVLGELGIDFNAFSPAHSFILVTQSIIIVCTIALIIRVWGFTPLAQLLILVSCGIMLRVFMEATISQGEWALNVDNWYLARPGWTWATLGCLVATLMSIFTIKVSKAKWAATILTLVAQIIYIINILAMRAWGMGPQDFPLYDGVLLTMFICAIIVDYMAIKKPKVSSLQLGLIYAGTYWAVGLIIFPLFGDGQRLNSPMDIPIGILVSLFIVWVFSNDLGWLADKLGHMAPESE